MKWLVCEQIGPHAGKEQRLHAAAAFITILDHHEVRDAETTLVLRRCAPRTNRGTINKSFHHCWAKKWFAARFSREDFVAFLCSRPLKGTFFKLLVHKSNTFLLLSSILEFKINFKEKKKKTLQINSSAKWILNWSLRWSIITTDIKSSDRRNAALKQFGLNWNQVESFQ